MNPITFRLARPADFADESTDDQNVSGEHDPKAGGPQVAFGASSSAKDELKNLVIGGKDVLKDASQGPMRMWGSKSNPGIICLVFKTELEFGGQTWEFYLKKMKRADKQDEQDWNIYPHATKDTVNVKMQPTGAGPHQIISALRTAGLLLRMCYSPKRDFIYVFVTATEQRIQEMAATLELLRPINPREAVKLSRCQKEKFSLAENTRLDFYSLKTEQNDPLRKKWERPWDAPGEFVINKSLDKPISLMDNPEQAKFGGAKDAEELRDQKTAEHVCSFVSMDAWKNVWIKYRTDISSKIWQKSDDGSIFTAQDKLTLIYKIMTSDQKLTGAELKMGGIQNSPGNPLVEVFALHDESKIDKIFRPASIFYWFWTGITADALDWESALYNIWCYYGEEIAWYFSFLQCFAHWLIVPILIESLPFAWGIYTGKALPLGSALFFIPMVYMSAVLAPRWAYRKSILEKQWGINKGSKIYNETFNGIYDVDVDTGKIELLRDPNEDQKAAQSKWSKLTSLFSVLVIGAFMFIQIIKLYASQQDSMFWTLVGGASGGANAACIILFEMIYNGIVQTAVVEENYRWRSEHENRFVSYAATFMAINNFGVVTMLLHIFPYLPIFSHYPEGVVEKGEFVMLQVGSFLTSLIITLLGMKIAKEYFVPIQMKKVLMKQKEANEGARKDHAVWDVAKGQPPEDNTKDEKGNLIRTFNEIEKMGLLVYEDRRDAALAAAWKLPHGFVKTDGVPLTTANQMIILQQAAENGMLMPKLVPVGKKIEGVLQLAGYIALFFIVAPYATHLAFFSVLAALYVDANVTISMSRRKLPRGVDDGIGAYTKTLDALPLLGVVSNWFVIVLMSDRLYTIMDWTVPELNVMPVRIGIGIVCVFPILYIFSQVISTTKAEYEPVLAAKDEVGRRIESFILESINSSDDKDGKKD